MLCTITGTYRQTHSGSGVTGDEFACSADRLERRQSGGGRFRKIFATPALGC